VKEEVSIECWDEVPTLDTNPFTHIRHCSLLTSAFGNSDI